jgi:hypothetical protein
MARAQYLPDLVTSVGPWIDARTYGDDLDNVTLQAAITAIGSDVRTLSIAPGAWAIALDVTVPLNITLKFHPGAVMTVATTKTLTIEGHIDADLHQLFALAGTGSVLFGRSAVEAVYPQWFGAIADWNGTTGTDNVTAINNAILSLPDGGKIKIVGRMSHSAAINVTQKICIDGGSSYGREWQTALYKGVSELHNSGTSYGLSCISGNAPNPEYGVVIENLWISGNAASSHGVYIEAIYNGVVRNCVLWDHGGYGIYGGSGCQLWNISGNFAQGCDGGGIYWSGLVNIVNNYLEGNTGNSVRCSSFGGTITGNVMENSSSYSLYITTAVYGGVISGNYFEMSYSSTGSIIYIDGTIEGCTITGNFIATNTTGINYGIRIAIAAATKYASGLIIQGNSFTGSGLYYGVHVDMAGSLGLTNAIFGPDHMLSGYAHGIVTPYYVTGTAITGYTINSSLNPWLPSVYYRINVRITNDSGKVYECITAGTTAAATGPTGTAADITDGTAHWKFYASTDKAIKSYGNQIVFGRVMPSTLKAEPGSGNVTLTAAMLAGGLVDEDPEGAANWTLDTAANIVKAVHGMDAGTTFKCILHNDATAASAEVVTIVTAAGVTLHGTTVTLTEGTNEVAELTFRVVDAGVGIEAVDCYILTHA